jgi:flavin-dependent dehydrogenase
MQSAASTAFDAVVIGAGPAGSTVSALLAEYGHRVLVLEREKFPRYHIGESLLPFTHYPLKRLGLLEKMRRSPFVNKFSVQFVNAAGTASLPFYFSTRYDKDVAQTWQVLRSEFDLMLMQNARDKGAVVQEETTVRELLKEGERVVGVKAVTADGTVREYRATMTLDCSGRESFSASRHGWRIPDPVLNKVAVWTYYKGAKRDAGIDAGATTIAAIPEKGWFWYIPQHDDMVSVGVVAEHKYLFRDGVRELAAVFAREVERNAWIKAYLAQGERQGGYFTTGEYSFRSRHCACPGLLLIGDAYGFLDPVFSSGVMLALKGGMLAADAVHAALQAGDASPRRFEAYGNTMIQGTENMRRLVYAFYDANFSFRTLTRKRHDVVDDITDCLSGDVNKNFDRLFTACAEFAAIPEPLPYGGPLG